MAADVARSAGLPAARTCQMHVIAAVINGVHLARSRNRAAIGGRRQPRSSPLRVGLAVFRLRQSSGGRAEALRAKAIVAFANVVSVVVGIVVTSRRDRRDASCRRGVFL